MAPSDELPPDPEPGDDTYPYVIQCPRCWATSAPMVDTLKAAACWAVITLKAHEDECPGGPAPEPLAPAPFTNPPPYGVQLLQ